MLARMDTADVHMRIDAMAAVHADASASRGDLEGGLRAASVVKSWIASLEADCAARLAKVASCPEDAISKASRRSRRDAGSVLERAGTLDATPALAGALHDGTVTPGHVDAVTKVAKSLDGRQRDELLDRADQLAGFAAGSTTTEFRRRLEAEAKKLRTDDGEGRFQQQLAAVRLRRWVDADGMGNMAGKWDPLSTVRLNARIDAEIEALFSESVPDGCPTDPTEKYEYLAALALASILDGGGIAQRAGRPEFVVVVDTTATDAGVTVDWGLPVEVPNRVLADLFPDADIHGLVVRNGVVLHAPGELNLGRTTRLANKAQRRALRALYPTCGVHGCDVRFAKCKIHHVVWWRHGGRTDLANLIPVCVHHHTQIHGQGWVVTLSVDRQLTIRYPDGTIHITGPPRRAAA
jgi:hypothetical protein